MNDKKAHRLIADMDKALVVWIEYQTSYNIPFSQSLIHSKALTLLNSVNAKRGEEATEAKFEASRGWFMRFRKEAVFII